MERKLKVWPVFGIFLLLSATIQAEAPETSFNSYIAVINATVRFKPDYKPEIRIYEGVVLADNLIATVWRNLKRLHNISDINSITIFNEPKEYKQDLHSIIQHPDYDGFNYNLGLIKLTNNAKLLSNKPPLKIPKQKPSPDAKAIFYGLHHNNETDEISLEKAEVSVEDAYGDEFPSDIVLKNLQDAGKFQIYGAPLITADGSLVGILKRRSFLEPKWVCAFENMSLERDWIAKKSKRVTFADEASD